MSQRRHQFTVRPSNSEKDAFRVKLTAPSLLSLRVSSGDILLLSPADHDDDIGGGQPAIAWDGSSGGMKDHVVHVSKFLQELYGFKLGDKISITRSQEKLSPVEVVTVECVSATLSIEEQKLWQAEMSTTMPVKHDILVQGQNIMLEMRGQKTEFKVRDVGGLLGRVMADTKFVFDRGQDTKLELNFDKIGGLQREIEQVREVAELLLDQKLRERWPTLPVYNGLLLYGQKGTGKTMFQETLAENDWGSVVRWTPGTKLPTPVLPRLIIADLLDVSSSSKATSDLLAIFRETKGTPTLVVGETRHPNDISERLRSRDAFSIELELPIPDADQRIQILRVLNKEIRGITDDQLRELATRTHGYVGADLRNLMDQMLLSAWRQWKKSAVLQNGHVPSSVEKISATRFVFEDAEAESRDTNTSAPFGVDAVHEERDITITARNMNESLTKIRPSALQQVFLEKPTVRWSDIGGQHDLKHKLTTAVERILSPIVRKRMSRLGVKPTKGILLYGPPGCSKTLLAKALATEAELNFLAVKGAELVSMYVGESERATREVFRKARAAAPSILFFDEIDAIASRSSSSSSRGGANEINVLTTLLNEMDGFEELKGVLVLAATNKPQQIDPALLRPGRFDKVVYVDLPDEHTRREIFENHFRADADADVNAGADVDAVDRMRDRASGFARDTPGFSGAEIVAICQTAGEYALDRDADDITPEDVHRAIHNASRGISEEMKEEYRRWNASRSRV